MIPKWLKAILGRPHAWFERYFFDPWLMLKKWTGLWFFIKNGFIYTSRNSSNFSFPINFSDTLYRSYDRFSSAGVVPVHYFLQDIWVARFLFERGHVDIVDVGSRVDGYIGHLLVFAKVNYIDLRPLDFSDHNFYFKQGNITRLPFPDESVTCVSCLHVIEHIGLGRYGDEIDPDGFVKGATELQRILAPGGLLIISTVIGRERLVFDAHRVFDPETVLTAFSGVNLETFALIDDEGQTVKEQATLQDGRACAYGCGIFVFKKNGGNICLKSGG